MTTLSLFRTLWDTQTHHCEVTEARALEYLTTPRKTTAKNKLPLWSPTEFTPGSTRLGANAVAIHWLVFDMDDGLSSFDSWQIWGKLGYTVAAHTSYSHTPEHHKYRIALPLLEPIPAIDWPRAAIAANELWAKVVGVGVPDSSALNDRARAYYQYGFQPGKAHNSGIHIAGNLRLKYGHIGVSSEVRRAPRMTRKHIADADTMLDTRVREAIAHHTGAKIQGNEARQIRCPGCGQDTVHFSIDLTLAGSTKWATCNRLNNCRWYGHLKEL